VVDNRYTLAALGIDSALWAPQDMFDYTGHGTHVSSVAGGMVHGVASKANLVIVKFRNGAKNPFNPSNNNFVIRGVTPPALADAWDWIIDDVAQQRQSGNNGKFVINMSYGGFSVPFPNMGANRW
jgi:subtilisin family serine protease